jgi:ferritin-like metal-binding protein YciE
MENMNQLKDLLKHELRDLYSAEEQIIDALPKMIEKAGNNNLKKALTEHLQVTEEQKNRLDEVMEYLQDDMEEEGGGFLGIFKGNEKCKAMEGLISEGEKLMREDMSPDVMDAAIIAAAQKIEHYEISSYGTVRSYAQELNLDEAESLLKQTLDEEYEADDLLTELAEGRINQKAKAGEEREGGRSGSRRISSNGGKSRSRSAATATASSERKSSSRNGGGAPARKTSGRSSSTSRSSRNGAPAKKSSSKNKTSSGRGRSSGRSSR